MKIFKPILTLLLIFTSLNIFSQEVDKVYLKNKEVISGKILNVTSNNIEIDPVGKKPFLLFKRNDVKLIIYSDNTIVTFDDENINTNDKSFKTNSNNDIELDSKKFIDQRNGEEYKIKKIGDQVWMVESMRIDIGSYYRPDVEYYDAGYYYDFEAAQIVCPDGWRLPSDEDWMELINKFGGMRSSTSKKIRSQKKYPGGLGRGSNTSGFTAVPSGKKYWKYPSQKILTLNEDGAYFWSDSGTFFVFEEIYKVKNQSLEPHTSVWIQCRCIRGD